VFHFDYSPANRPLGHLTFRGDCSQPFYRGSLGS